MLVRRRQRRRGTPSVSCRRELSLGRYVDARGGRCRGRATGSRYRSPRSRYRGRREARRDGRGRPRWGEVLSGAGPPARNAAWVFLDLCCYRL
ncbi:hypothetical protein NL676_012192 [Syzygium grande]|nr:hypothetical protein NL676_012192 [Syzygium grande]